MLEKMNSIYHMVYSTIQGNQMLTAGLGVYGLGIITYLVRDIPMRVWGRIKMESTTTLTLNSQDAVFYDVLKWMDDLEMKSLKKDLKKATKKLLKDIGS